MNTKLKIILSGGGTGGHIYPAVAIAKAIQKNYTDVEILFIGANGRMEMEKVPAAGFHIKGIDIIGLQRKLTLKNIFIPYYLFKSIQQVKKIFQEFRPDVVIGTGGYVSFPVLLTAQFQNIPNYIQEQNAYAGLANKLLAKKARKIFVAFNDMEKFFPKDKIVVSGNPIRNDLEQLDILKEKSISFFNLKKDRPIVLVIGGSLGAKSINETIYQNINFFKNHSIQLIWQMGKSFYNQLTLEMKQSLNHPDIFYKDFIYEMNLAYAAADLIISRAGASTIAELAMVGKPTILIPSPNVTDDHQTKNALSLVHQNAAILVKDNEVTQKLIPTIDKILNDLSLQNELSKNIKKLSQPDAANLIVQTILNDLKSLKHNS
ncbi:MAG: UDP-N-acetylglucosamine--N-acetylmuramyl-(pentapeptide) pyrophosphoryl-undecaprenol N-acetylglucosamine transferase [Bacteroidia bacterium]|nr:MAG: UDP-N-acetylglucosamine--N-acetylmuramyl-(pentapeptide) pyrophosphoryl-undecaprenol N-acetylglucosamine transferase [Bacteroidia bacterium]